MGFYCFRNPQVFRNKSNSSENVFDVFVFIRFPAGWRFRTLPRRTFVFIGFHWEVFLNADSAHVGQERLILSCFNSLATGKAFLNYNWAVDANATQLVPIPLPRDGISEQKFRFAENTTIIVSIPFHRENISKLIIASCERMRLDASAPPVSIPFHRESISEPKSSVYTENTTIISFDSLSTGKAFPNSMPRFGCINEHGRFYSLCSGMAFRTL